MTTPDNADREAIGGLFHDWLHARNPSDFPARMLEILKARGWLSGAEARKLKECVDESGTLLCERDLVRMERDRALASDESGMACLLQIRRTLCGDIHNNDHIVDMAARVMTERDEWRQRAEAAEESIEGFWKRIEDDERYKCYMDKEVSRLRAALTPFVTYINSCPSIEPGDRVAGYYDGANAQHLAYEDFNAARAALADTDGNKDDGLYCRTCGRRGYWLNQLRDSAGCMPCGITWGVALASIDTDEKGADK